MAADMSLRGWNAYTLARQADVTPHTVYRFLSGTTQTPKTAQKLAHALGYTPRRYFAGIEAA